MIFHSLAVAVSLLTRSGSSRLLTGKPKLHWNYDKHSILKWILKWTSGPSRINFLSSVVDKDALGIRVAYGSNDLVTMYDRKQYAEIEKIILHPDYQFSFGNMALIKLKQPLNFTEAVEPACLLEHERYKHFGVLKVIVSLYLRPIHVINWLYWSIILPSIL